MTGNIRLSVIIPAHNAASSIGAQLSALSGQHWSEPWEVIVADNGSTDGTAAVAEPYRSRLPYLRVIDAADRPGAAHARNAGARAARGVDLVFIDADDVVAPGWLRTMAEALQDHEFVASRFDFVKLNPQWIQRVYGSPQVEGLQPLWYPPYLPHAGGCGLGIRRSIHEAVGGFDETGSGCPEDTDYCIRVQQAGVPLHFAQDATIYIRHRETLRALFRQSRTWALQNSAMFRRYRGSADGLPGSWRRYLKDWQRLIRKTSRVRTREQLAVCVARVGWQIGLLEGALLYRVPPVVFTKSSTERRRRASDARTANRRTEQLIGLAVVMSAGCAGDQQVVEPPRAIAGCVYAAHDSGHVPITAPLRAHPRNARYFMDGTGQPILLVGSHHWQNLQHRNEGPFSNPDYAEYLDCLSLWGHNFIRLWMWEDMQNEPLPWARTGPGSARDGRPRFDLTRFDDEYFRRLRVRTEAARDRGFYVAVMLFQGWSVDAKLDGREIWTLHPFHRDNNVNGINGDANGDGQGREVHTLSDPLITALQESYVRRVVNTLHDLENVLWEISNESHGDSRDWQLHMLRFVRSQDAALGSEHPVGLTVAWPRGGNDQLLDSPADWISPNERGPSKPYDYRTDPPPAGAHKVVIVDSDHLPGDQGADWVWKTFFRGMHPIMMDYLDSDAERQQARTAMGRAAQLAQRLDLSVLVPVEDVASSRYALADTVRGSALVAYTPDGRVIVDLSTLRGPVSVEWFEPETGVVHEDGTAGAEGSRSFQAPFGGPAILHLSGRGAT